MSDAFKCDVCGKLNEGGPEVTLIYGPPNECGGHDSFHVDFGGYQSDRCPACTAEALRQAIAHLEAQDAT